MTEKKTTDFEIPYATWCVKAVQLYLEKKHKIEVTCQKLYSILLKNEVTSKFAARSNFRMEPDKRDEFIHVGFAKICWRAFEEGRELLFGDETTTMRGFRRKGYALKGKRTYTA